MWLSAESSLQAWLAPRTWILGIRSLINVEFAPILSTTARNHVCAIWKHGLDPTAAAGAELGDSGKSGERPPGEGVPPETNRRQTQSLFHTYSQFANASNIPPKPSEEERDTESKIEDLLEKVRG